MFLNGYDFNKDTGEWTTELVVQIYDHFGLDDNDLNPYQYFHFGFAAWWILQHKKGYKPLRTNILLNVKLKGNINE